MKKICLNCKYVRCFNDDIVFSTYLEAMRAAEDDYLICTHSRLSKKTKDGGIYPRVEDDFTCDFYRPNKERLFDIKAGC